ncbi:hypothetical protein [Lewinella sp. 4G2]|uniref:hypothetical protein n=1 Tax=Lewinella sp. 4G2 TaxID=1803372 RepID=UPI0007B4E311|nr:hypothetical protein [Lewinella sp. 4G2]OAV44512.1 hypothetical protein A3850_008420 [Lewinella sp. 4G2]
MAYSNRFSPKKHPRPQPEVADREPEPTEDCPDTLNLSINPATQELEDLRSFKVFIKKNLPLPAPPAGLLAGIFDRIDQIKAEEG